MGQSRKHSFHELPQKATVSRENHHDKDTDEETDDPDLENGMVTDTDTDAEPEERVRTKEPEEESNQSEEDDLKEVHLCEAVSRMNEDSTRKKEVTTNADGVLYLMMQASKEVMIPPSEHNQPEVQAAMKEELKRLEMFGTYEEVDNVGQEKIGG